MRGSWKRISEVVVMAVFAFGIIAPVLQAGSAAAGKFKLPFDAQFGNLTLPRGDYEFRVDGLALNGKIVILQANRPVGMVHPQLFSDQEDQNKKPVLLCIRHDGNTTVRALRLPNVGTFYFSLPKELEVLVAQQPQLIQTVSVEVVGD